MLTSIKRWLRPPQFPGEEEKSAQARIMNSMGLYFVLALVVTTIVYVPLFVTYKAESWVVIPALLVFYAISRYLMFRGNLVLAGLFMAASGLIMIILLSSISGGIFSPILFTLSVVTIAVSLLFPPRTGNIFLAISLLAGFGLAVVQQNEIVLPQYFVYSPVGSWFIFALSLVFINRTILLTVHKNLERMRLQNAVLEKTEKTLLQRNQEMATLYQTSLEITALSDLSALLNALVQRACALLNLSSGVLHLVRFEEEMLEVVVTYQTPPHWIGLKFRFDEGLAGRVVQTKKPVIIEDYQTWEGRLPIFHDSPARRTLGIPIIVRDHVIGVLVLLDHQDGTFSEEDVRLLNLFAGQAAIAIENARLYTAVQQLAITDGLTGLYNRLFFDAELARIEISREFPVSIIVADLDNMKTTNDALGHPIGDELLKNAAQILRGTFRAADILARTGGDEFGILLPKTDSATAGQILERIRAKIADFNTTHPDLPIHLSLGVSTAETGGLIEALFVADQCMYSEKARRKSPSSPISSEA